MNSLEQLKKYTKVVADTGDFESIKQFKPLDSTTNPSLIYAASQDPKYDYLIGDAISYGQARSKDKKAQLSYCMDRLAVNFGLEILKVVPGRVSTEVDARLSFDTKATLEKARFLIRLYESSGIPRQRILIKIASTWEGIKAAEVLETEGIHTNLTLLFNKAQAIACAEAGVQLISPFVGRILDWHKKDRGISHIEASADPGVLSVAEIFNYYKKFDYKTEIMGASFRNIGEIIELAGCDLLTISPQLLAELELANIEIEAKLNVEQAKSQEIEKINLDEKTFRWLLNEDAMATEKLAEGIRKFSADLVKLENFIASKL
ncbi:MAG TPA: transaldolase [Bacteroidales bacterium]|nr:transaldolase [Bacteroidales bacterium]